MEKNNDRCINDWVAVEQTSPEVKKSGNQMTKQRWGADGWKSLDKTTPKVEMSGNYRKKQHRRYR